MNLKLEEIINLYYELNGITQTSEEETKVLTQGILKQKMSLKLKVYLQRLNAVLLEDLKLYEEARKELFQKYGNEENGSITITQENLVHFNVEHSQLMSAEKIIDVNSLWGDNFTLDNLEDVETEEFYPLLFKLIDKSK
jgi:hypothetical protein